MTADPTAPPWPSGTDVRSKETLFMFGRYKRLVPRAQRKLIEDEHIPRLNWFVGAAEQPLVPHDPSLIDDIRGVRARIDAHAERKVGGGGAAAEPADVPGHGLRADAANPR